jgi:hypothetical protein
MLVVSNAYLNPHIRPLIPEAEFIHSLERTILLLERLSPMSPVFRKNMEVLRHAQADVRDVYKRAHAGDPPHTGYDQLHPQHRREYEQQQQRREHGQSQSPGRSHAYSSHQPHHSGSYSAAPTPAAQSSRPSQAQQPPPPPGEPQQKEQQAPQQQWPQRSYSVSYSSPGGPATPGTPQFSTGGAAPTAAAPTAGVGNGGGDRAERGDRTSGGPVTAPSSFSAPQR